MPYENILTEQKNATLHITINRASKLNALNKNTICKQINTSCKFDKFLLAKRLN